MTSLLLVGFTTLATCKAVQVVHNNKSGHLVSFVHALFQTIMSALVLSSVEHFSCGHLVSDTVPLSRWQVVVLLCYTLFDLYEHTNAMDMLIHHWIVVACCLIALSLDTHQMVGEIVLINEVSTIFLNLMRMKIYAKASGICFAISFVLARVVLLPLLLLELWECAKTTTDWCIIGIICALLCVNLVWFRKICQRFCAMIF
jgi:hypothetical protein